MMILLYLMEAVGKKSKSKEEQPFIEVYHGMGISFRSKYYSNNLDNVISALFKLRKRLPKSMISLLLCSRGREQSQTLVITYLQSNK